MRSIGTLPVVFRLSLPLDLPLPTTGTPLFLPSPDLMRVAIRTPDPGYSRHPPGLTLANPDVRIELLNWAFGG